MRQFSVQQRKKEKKTNERNSQKRRECKQTKISFYAKYERIIRI